MERDWFFSTICVDIDGVLVDTRNCTVGCDYSGYPDSFEQLDRENCPLKEGAVEALKELQERGSKPVKVVDQNLLRGGNTLMDEFVRRVYREIDNC